MRSSLQPACRAASAYDRPSTTRSTHRLALASVQGVERRGHLVTHPLEIDQFLGPLERVGRDRDRFHAETLPVARLDPLVLDEAAELAPGDRVQKGRRRTGAGIQKALARREDLREGLGREVGRHLRVVGPPAEEREQTGGVAVVEGDELLRTCGRTFQELLVAGRRKTRGLNVPQRASVQ